MGCEPGVVGSNSFGQIGAWEVEKPLKAAENSLSDILSVEGVKERIWWGGGRAAF